MGNLETMPDHVGPTSSTEPTARLLRLLSLLQGGQEWPGRDLAERTGRSSRTVRRDIDRLRELGYPVHATRGSTGYRLEAGSNLPPLVFDDDEAVAIVIGLRTAAARSVTGMDETAARALAKLERLLPSRLRHQVGAFDALAVPATSVGPTVDPELVSRVVAACSDRQRLRFDYTAHDGTSSRRLVDPHRLVHTGRRWYLVAYDLTRSDWRSFRLDRLRLRGHVGPRFEPRAIPGGDVVAFVTRGVTSRLWQHQVRARLHASAEAVAERLPRTAGALVAVGKDRCLLDLGGDRLDRLAADLCAIGVDFDVVEAPDGFNEHLAALAHRADDASGR